MTLRIRHLAQVNPPTPTFDALASTAELTFMPLETVWADNRLDTKRVAVKADVSSGYVRFQDGDILVPKTAPTFQHARTTLVTGLTNGVGVGSSELHLLRPKSGSEARFLAYVMRSSSFVAQGATAYQGVAGLQRVPVDFVADWPVLPFSTQEQRRIADFLDEQVVRLDRAISLRRRQDELLSEIRSAALSAAMSGRAPTGRTHPVLGPISEDTMPTKLVRAVRQIAVGVVVNPSSYFVSEGVPFIHGYNVRDGWLDLTEYKRMLPSDSESMPRSRLLGGEVLVVRAGYPGRAVVVPPELAGANCASVLILRCGPTILPDYLATFFNAPQGRGQVKVGQYGAAQEVISAGQVAEYSVPVVPIDEQRRRLDHLTAEVELITRAEQLARQHHALLEERKQALITAAVTGQFDVTTARAVA